MTSSSLDALRSAWHRITKGYRSFFGIYVYAVTWRYLILRMTRSVFWKQRTPLTNRYLVALPAYASEGIGGQFVKWNTARLLSRKHGLIFVHHPFTPSSHSPGLDWEGFLGFGVGEIEYSSLATRSDMHVVDLPPLHITAVGAFFGKASMPADFLSLTLGQVLAPEPVLFRLGPDTWMDAQAHELEELRRKYRVARSTEMTIDHNPLTAVVTVAVHIRRGDVRTLKEIGSDEGNRRWIDEVYYAKLCNGINGVLGVGNVEIRVYSDDIPESFEILPSISNVHFRIYEGAPVDADIAFNEMVSADVLVIGMSSFSYLAALLSEGVKLVPYPYAHEVPSDWINCGAAGSFDAQQLSALMEGRLQDKSRPSRAAEAAIEVSRE